MAQSPRKNWPVIRLRLFCRSNSGRYLIIFMTIIAINIIVIDRYYYCVVVDEANIIEIVIASHAQQTHVDLHKTWTMIYAAINIHWVPLFVFITVVPISQTDTSDIQCRFLQVQLRSYVVRPSVCPSVTLVDQDHIGWKSWKLIARTLSPTHSLFVAKRDNPRNPSICYYIGFHG